MRRLAFALLLLVLIPSTAYAAECGGDVPCFCGDTLVESRTLTSLDQVTLATCPSDGLRIYDDGVALDCGGRTIEGPGVYDGIITEAVGVTIRNCVVRNFINGIFLNGTNQSFVIGNTVFDNSRSGIFLNRSTGNMVEDNTADGNNDGAGIYAIGGTGNVYSRNSASYSSRGIAIANTGNARIENNTASHNSRYGIYLSGATNSIVINNTADMNGMFGIYLIRDSDSNRLDFNTVTGSLEMGIVVDSSSQGIIMVQNTVCRSSDIDISVASPSGSTGSKNRCETTWEWNDGGYDNCTYLCAPLERIDGDCFDGTPAGVCSVEKPIYCDGGILRYNCTICGCPTGQACDRNGTGGCYGYSPFNCTDGTQYGQCAIKKPLLCEDGELVENCARCGCPKGYGCNTTSGSCFIVDTCKDGTPWGMCSPGYLCVNGTLSENCTICGCPADRKCNASNEKCYLVNCTSDDDCPGQHCDGIYCRDMKGIGAACSQDKECLSGQCVSSVCSACRTNVECPTTERCQDGRCVAVPCDGVVSKHVCQPYECSSDQECSFDQECLNRFCSPLSCAEGQVIKDHMCAEREFYIPDYVMWGGIGLVAIIIIGLMVRFRPKPGEVAE